VCEKERRDHTTNVASVLSHFWTGSSGTILIGCQPASLSLSFSLMQTLHSHDTHNDTHRQTAFCLWWFRVEFPGREFFWVDVTAIKTDRLTQLAPSRVQSVGDFSLRRRVRICVDVFGVRLLFALIRLDVL